MGRNHSMYQELFYLANELVIDCARKSNAKKGIVYMLENLGKLMVCTPRRDKLGI
jgi:hypothetical protein